MDALPDQAPVIFVVAGEASGDILASGLIRALRDHYPGAHFVGVTGPRMRQQGCESLADIAELSLFGVTEVITQIPRLLRLRQRLYRQALARQAAVFIGVDAPAFNTDLEIRLRRAGLKTVHYVCPTAWAWRSGRVTKIRRAVDLMLGIFPFEPEFFAAHDIPVTFVGHPLADALPMQPATDTARQQLGLTGRRRWVGLLPGSRGSEVTRLGDQFLAVARWLQKRDSNVGFIIPAANAELKALLVEQCRQFPELDVQVLEGQSQLVMQAADALLVASGTATLEALLAKTPMVVAYRLSQGNYWLVKGLRLLKTEFVSMPNLLADRALVPELLQADAQIEILGAWLYCMLHRPAMRERQLAGFVAIHKQLACAADSQAAQAIARLLDDRS